jgi:hypothetical protein
VSIQLLFIKELPSSLEELYLTINADCDRQQLMAAEDPEEVFPPLGNPIFSTLRRLHACDICMWISPSPDDEIPHFAIHWRRLAHATGTDNKSAVLCNLIVRCGEFYEMRHEHEVVEISNDSCVFEGDGATQDWLKKTEETCEARIERAANFGPIQNPWPAKQDIMDVYARYDREG